jgi:hypothetical protein
MLSLTFLHRATITKFTAVWNHFRRASWLHSKAGPSMRPSSSYHFEMVEAAGIEIVS